MGTAKSRVEVKRRVWGKDRRQTFRAKPVHANGRLAHAAFHLSFILTLYATPIFTFLRSRNGGNQTTDERPYSI